MGNGEQWTEGTRRHRQKSNNIKWLIMRRKNGNRKKDGNENHYFSSTIMGEIGFPMIINV